MLNILSHQRNANQNNSEILSYTCKNGQNQKHWWRAGEMAQWLRALTAPPEDPGSIPSTHMAAHNCLWLQFHGIQHSHTEGKNTNVYKINLN